MGDSRPLFKRTLVVTGISTTLTNDQLLQLFNKYKAQKAFVFDDSESAGIQSAGFVVFETRDSMRLALEAEVVVESFKLVLREAVSDDENAIAALADSDASSDTSELEDQLRSLDPGVLARIVQRLLPSVVSPTSTLPKVNTSSLGQGVDSRSTDVQRSDAQVPLPVPKLPIFSGDLVKGEPSKGELSYAQWRYSVQCLEAEGHSPAVILRSIRQSLRGTAAEVMRGLRENTTLGKVFRKFEDTFKTYLSKDQLFPMFYSAQQGFDESVAVWGCRLEDLALQIVEQGGVSDDTSRDMLRTKFWSGLRDTHLREATRYKLDSGESYEELFRSVRKVEQEFLAQNPRKPVVKQEIKARDQSGDQNLLKQIASGIEEVKKDVAELSRRVGKLESSSSEVPTKQSSQKQASSPRRKRKSVIYHRCGRPGHIKPKCVAKFYLNGKPLNEETPSQGAGPEGVNQ